MKFIILFQLCISVSYAGIIKKLIGGSRASIRSFPYQASIRYRNKHICGATIITNYHLITSANCLSADRFVIYSNLKVLSGTSDQSDINANNNAPSVNYIIFHPRYNPKKFWDHDIAIIRVSSPMDFTEARYPIKLQTSTLRYGTVVYSAGWGQVMNTNSPTSTRYLRQIKLKIQDYSTCRRYFESLNCYQGCVKMTSPDSGVSKGDGGNGLVSIASGKLVGIISIYSPITGFPVVITKLFPYLNFMEIMLERY